MKVKTAILVFVNSSKEELLHKPIIGGERLFTELTKKTLKVVKKAGLPYFVFTEKDQQGKTFGERFVHAIESTYGLGFENIITIGNDTPHLKKHHLLESAIQLENRKFVLGPSLDGGFYLMGLHKSQFNRSAFLNLPWQSKELAKNISNLIKTAKIEIAQLETLRDIDCINDLKTIAKLAFAFSTILKKIIYRIIHPKKEVFGSYKLLKDTYQISSFYNKGSPFSLA
ncbi:TIGR04282 family arsenosugar biosynthesis glycosyltransferase [Aquimarina sp. M1]